MSRKTNRNDDMLHNNQLPSPARLGLTNPNSPSLPPSSSNVNPKLPPSSCNRFSTTSSHLLPLLPPLSRAQLLLQQMSALATRLFDLSPNASMWLSSFRGSLPVFLSSPASSVNFPPLDLPPLSSVKEGVALIKSLQTQLFEAVAELQEILDLQDAKGKLSREIRSKDVTLLAFTKKIKEAEHVLDVLVDDYADYRRPKRPKQDEEEDDDDEGEDLKGPTFINIRDILSYAHKISYTTFAPPEFGAGQAPLRGALPPAPQDEQMRASLLYRVDELDLGLPKSLVHAKDKMTDNVLVNLIEPTPPREDLVPPVSSIKVPPGWTKGMPVDISMHLPPVPPHGWKPGDPVPLPPIEDFLNPKRVEDPLGAGPPVLPAMPLAQSRQPEAIQVKYVQLDINPDDEYSSEYSSDVGSSDEEDDD